MAYSALTSFFPRLLLKCCEIFLSLIDKDDVQTLRQTFCLNQKCDFSPFCTERFEQVYRFETLLHIAVEQCDIEMVKILLIYGADTSLRRINSRELPPFLEYGYCDWDEEHDPSPEDRNSIHSLLQAFVDQDFESRDIHESVDVFAILERAKRGDQNLKKEIAALLRLERGNCFPELLDLYPGDEGEALRFMFKEWNTPLPLEVIEEIAQFYYSVTHLLESTEDDVDIKKMMRYIWQKCGDHY